MLSPDSLQVQNPPSKYFQGLETSSNSSPCSVTPQFSILPRNWIRTLDSFLLLLNLDSSQTPSFLLVEIRFFQVSAFPGVQMPSRYQLNPDSTSFPDPNPNSCYLSYSPIQLFLSFSFSAYSCLTQIPAHLHPRAQLLLSHRTNLQIHFFSRPAPL